MLQINYISTVLSIRGRLFSADRSVEAQRIKLAKCLGAKIKGKNLYILDEPTAGINSKDIELLEKILLKLNQENETVLIIEYNIEFISHVADYLVDVGRNAGNKGGETIIQGKPIEVVRNVESSWNNIIN